MPEALTKEQIRDRLEEKKADFIERFTSSLQEAVKTDKYKAANFIRAERIRVAPDTVDININTIESAFISLIIDAAFRGIDTFIETVFED